MAENVVNLSAAMVTDLLEIKQLITAVEMGLSNFSKGPEGGIVQPVRSVVPIDRPDGTDCKGYFGVMPVYSASDKALACKLVSFYPGNDKHKKPTHSATILLYDPMYGELRAIMDGEVITSLRTAAASAVATKHLVEDCSKPLKLAIMGAGVQARSHYEALKAVVNISQICVWSRTMASAMKCAEEINGEACLSAEEAVENADVIVTVTFSQTPIIKKAWVKPGAHINAVGACRPDWQEIDPELMRSSVVYVDSRDAAMKEAGDIILSNAEIYAEIGEIVNGSKPVKRDPFTVFKSLGMGIEDAVAAKLVYDKYLASK